MQPPTEAVQISRPALPIPTLKIPVRAATPPKAAEGAPAATTSAAAVAALPEVTPRTEIREAYSPYFREYAILIEYKHLPKYVPSGIYVLPSYDSLYIWHAVLFIRQGPYRQGVFRFGIEIPENYPEQPPAVRFITPMFHPLIGASGELDIMREFPNWTPHKDYIWHVLAYVKRIFYITGADKLSHPVNIEAYTLFLNNKQEYMRRVEECVANSINTVYDQNENSSIRFREWSPELEKTREELFKEQGGEGVQKVAQIAASAVTMLAKGVTAGVSKLINIKY